MKAPKTNTTSILIWVAMLITDGQALSTIPISSEQLRNEYYSNLKGNQHQQQHSRQELSHTDLNRPHDLTTPTCQSPNTSSSRRHMLHTAKSAILGGFCGWILEPNLSHMFLDIDQKNAHAVLVTDPSQPPSVPTAETIPSFVQGTVTIPDNFDVQQALVATQQEPPFRDSTMRPTPALYITVRPDRPDNVPQAILDGSRGKPPPVLTARYEKPTFPFSFQLTQADFTVEGKPADSNEEEVWWNRDNLIVSARLDMDGIAATRSPQDLVGRTMMYPTQSGNAVTVHLGSRGAFGKFATKK